MAHWLVKSEPNVFSWDDLAKSGSKGEPWTGVRNHTAKLNLIAMKKGDRVFYYHSNEGKAVVGIAEVVKTSYPDPTADAGSPWVCVDIKAVTPFKAPVSLDDAKKIPALADMMLVKFSRFSVQPVSDGEWATVCKLGGVKP